MTCDRSRESDTFRTSFAQTKWLQAKRMLDQGFTSSSSRPWRLKLRADLETTRQSYQGRDYWVVKDPLSLKYFRFEEEEYALFKMLDGKASPESIQQRFNKKFAPQKITLQELFQFVGMLYRSSLLISDVAGQGTELKSRGEQNRKRQGRANLTNVLAIRFRGFDPDGLLSFLNRRLGWFFSTPALLFVVLYAIGGLLLVFAQWDVFQTKLPRFQEFFAFKNWFLLAGTLAFTKVLHELGHGIACRRFGGQCHEMGVMFLVLTPCLYCNVSDSWTLPSKWKRAGIAAAGMYVEFFLAATATYVWWFSQPGLVNQLALNIVFVCSVSTLLFNANPLLRYDGYYILADLIEVPNLRQKATRLLQRVVGRWMLGLQSQQDPFLPTRHKWFFYLYSVAAVVYRWFITFVIFWFLYHVLEPYGFKLIGQAIALFAIYGLLALPIMQLFRFIRIPGKVASVKKFNLGLAVGILCLAIIGILAVPLPHYVYCKLSVQSKDSQKVYVDYPGVVTQIEVAANQPVAAGAPILNVSNADLMFAIVELESQVELAKINYKHVVYVSNQDESRANEIDSALTTYEALKAKLAQKRRELEKMVIRSPAEGIVRFPPRVKRQPSNGGRLSGWSGTPLDEANLGAHLLEGTLVCEVENEKSRREAVLALDQSEMEFIQAGQMVEFRIAQFPNRSFESSIEKISTLEMKSVPKGLAARFGGDVLTETVEGTERPLSPLYQVSVPIENGELILPGATGTAKIRVGNRTVGQRLWRMACETFRFQL